MTRSSIDQDSEKSLLPLSNDEEYQDRLPYGLRRRSNNVQRASLGLNLVFLLCNILLLIFIFTRTGPSLPSFSSLTNGLPLPAKEAIRPELRTFKTQLVGNPLAGAPRPELEDAWHNLLRNDNIRVPKSVLDDLNLESVHLKGSDEVLASLGTFHALHCLKKVRQMTYKEHYHSGKDEAAMIRETAHSDHCIEYIREYLMCKPDLSFITYHWINNTAQNPDRPSLRRPTTWDHAQHECANWDAINGWAGNRVVDLYQYDLLELPDKGLTYSND